jgi:hypothetical protein
MSDLQYSYFLAFIFAIFGFVLARGPLWVPAIFTVFALPVSLYPLWTPGRFKNSDLVYVPVAMIVVAPLVWILTRTPRLFGFVLFAIFVCILLGAYLMWCARIPKGAGPIPQPILTFSKGSIKQRSHKKHRTVEAKAVPQVPLVFSTELTEEEQLLWCRHYLYTHQAIGDVEIERKKKLVAIRVSQLMRKGVGI